MSMQKTLFPTEMQLLRATLADFTIKFLQRTACTMFMDHALDMNIPP